jgi:hypothetical protein
MAQASTIWRLHRTEPPPAPPPEPAKTAHCADLQPDVPAEPSLLELQERSLSTRARGRFRLSRPQASETSYRLDGPAIMAVMNGAGPLDRSRDFAALAAQESFLRLARSKQLPLRERETWGGPDAIGTAPFLRFAP